MARIKPQALLLQSKKKKAPSRISITTIILYLFLLVFFVFAIRFSYRRWSSTKCIGPALGVIDGLSNSRLFVKSCQRLLSWYLNHALSQGEEPSFFIETLKAPKYAILSTSKGAISVELHKDINNESVRKFIELSAKGYFNGKPFHHISKHFAVVGGDADVSSSLNEAVKQNQVNSNESDVYMLGTFKEANKENGFSLIIVNSNSNLKEQINTFGSVVEGQDIVKNIEAIQTDENYRPKENFTIDVTLTEEI